MLQESGARISGAESSARFPLHLLSAVELECKLVFRLYGALETLYIILLKLVLCKGVIMLIHVGNPLKFQNFSSGSVMQDNYSVSYTTDFFPI